MVPWAGVEPATLRLGGGCSIRLSYQGSLGILSRVLIHVLEQIEQKVD